MSQISTDTPAPPVSAGEGFQDVAGKEHWADFWSPSQARPYDGPPLWHSVVSRYLPKRTDWEVFEVGCVPGGMLVYFHKEFGYTASGIDYLSQIDLVRRNLELNRVPCGELFQEDLFRFCPPRLYDVVFSNGFIEHFEDYSNVINKHAELVRPGGYLVLVVPNYTYLQYYARLVFDAPNLAKHRFEVMNPAILRDCVGSAGMSVLYCDYAVTFDFWIVRRGAGVRRWCTWFVEGCAGRCERLLARAGLDQIPNRWISPFVVCIARAPESAVAHPI